VTDVYGKARFSERAVQRMSSDLMLGVASVFLALVPDGRMALFFLGVAMLPFGALVALGAFAFQGMFPATFSARAAAAYFLVSATLGQPSAQERWRRRLIERLLGRPNDLGLAYAIFARA
jgi:hypothetical protein